MAEIVVSAFFSVFFEKLASETWKNIARAKGIDSELKKLKRSLIQINALLNDASQKEITDEAVKEWLNDLQHVAYDIDDVLDDLATDAMHRELTEESVATTSKVRKLIPTCCTNFSVSTRMRGKLDNITTKLQELVEEKNNLGLTVKGESPKHMNRKLQTSLVDASSIVGRQVEKDALLHKLLGDEPCDKNFSIVPIVGMGGVGKTTLARLLYDEFQGKDHFELKAWVCISDEFDIFNISKTIFQSIEGGKGNQDFMDLNLLQVALKEKISKKRFLVVLDDVWSESYTDWEILERPFLAGAPGSKVIITTRKLSLLNQLGSDQPYHLSVLSHDNALSLFCQHALGENNFDSHPILKPHGKGIVEKCDGLPLALIALGRLLRTKRDEEEWKELLNSEIWRLGKRDEIIPALRLSYNDLSASLKQLFAYCSLFPKDYVFNKEKLILLWMAEGFLHNENIDKSMERLGLESFEDLLSRSFFQHALDDKSLFVMHDLMNDLATFVAGDYFLTLDIEMKKEFRKEGLEKYRHMSFVCESYMVYKRFEPFKGAKNLRTFLAVPGMIESWTTFYLSNKVLVDLLQELPLLRVLSLSHLRIKEVPELIGSLKHLRYLNLSHTSITHLPENVCNLYNLQTLILSGCHYITKFPNNFTKLRNLRHLDIRNTPGLKKMSSGIGELKNLHTLSKIIIGGENSFAITELKNLENLHGKISIWGLGNVKNPMEAREANLSQKRLSELQLDWGYGDYALNVFQKQPHDKEVLNELKPHHDSLKKLEIVSYGGTEFPNWVGNPSFLGLTRVSLNFCEECTYLPSLGQLPSLKELFILGMSKVKVIDWKLLGAGLAFPSLEILSFGHMSGWEVWSTDNNNRVVEAAFPNLQELHIEFCPNLVQVSLEALSSLRVLKLQGCVHGVLTSLVHAASSVTMLEIDNISGLTDELWRSVIKYLGKLERLYISGCNEIRYLWQSEAEASKTLVNLRNLDVSGCSNLVSLGEKVEDNCGSIQTFIRMLSIARCQSMEHCSCPNSIEFLNIRGCDSITSVSFPTGGGQKLKSFSIGGCQKLLEEELGGEKSRLLINSSMQMLESVEINCWPNLKSIIELSCSIHLTTLTISKCPVMESFPDHEFLNLTSLKYLLIVMCTSMDASFPRGLWPPKLCFLGIGGLKKPISEWGPQNFPSSLDHLSLHGGPSEDVRNFSQLSHLLPSSLTSLSITEFQKLESVSMGLQHLTSLQHLSVSKCPKMSHLPEKLFPSLLSLRIDRCPNLKERSIRKAYWPLISLIPDFTFDE